MLSSGAIAESFHRQHEAAYGFASRDEGVMVVNLRVTGIGRVERPHLKTLDSASTRSGDGPERALKGTRHMHFSEAGAEVNTPIYDRTLFAAGDHIDGPAVIEQMDTTTVVPPGVGMDIDKHGNLLLRIPITQRQV